MAQGVRPVLLAQQLYCFVLWRRGSLPVIDLFDYRIFSFKVSHCERKRALNVDVFCCTVYFVLVLELSICLRRLCVCWGLRRKNWEAVS